MWAFTSLRLEARPSSQNPEGPWPVSWGTGCPSCRLRMRRARRPAGPRGAGPGHTAVISRRTLGLGPEWEVWGMGRGGAQGGAGGHRVRRILLEQGLTATSPPPQPLHLPGTMVWGQSGASAPRGRACLHSGLPVLERWGGQGPGRAAGTVLPGRPLCWQSPAGLRGAPAGNGLGPGPDPGGWQGPAPSRGAWGRGVPTGASPPSQVLTILGTDQDQLGRGLLVSLLQLRKLGPRERRVPRSHSTGPAGIPGLLAPSRTPAPPAPGSRVGGAGSRHRCHCCSRWPPSGPASSPPRGCTLVPGAGAALPETDRRGLPGGAQPRAALCRL